MPDVQESRSHPYWLRKKNTLVISPGSKANQQSIDNKIPPKVKKMGSFFKLSKGQTQSAIPLGLKGHISENYNANLKVPYVKQMFREQFKLGKGSYGKVYAYTSVKDGLCYAIKTISKHNKVREVLNMDVIDVVPNCIKYVNAWEENNIAYIQMELGEMSLADYAAKNHNINEEECWHILLDVITALKYIHEMKYCHMDVKPGNIIITRDGKYKLADFGLLMRYTPGQCNKALGSDGDGKYISLEALEGHMTPAGDIFSLGMTILEVAADLTLPDSGEEWHRLRDGSYIYVYNDRGIPRIGPELESIINLMISKSPNERPTANNLLRCPQLKKIARRVRINYYEAWRESQPPPVQGSIPLVFINPNGTSRPLTPSSEDGSTTPPHSVSSILICSSCIDED